MSAPVTLVLSPDEALVLFEWLARNGKRDRNIDDPAEDVVLWRLEAQLEPVLVEPLAPDYDCCARPPEHPSAQGSGTTRTTSDAPPDKSRPGVRHDAHYF